MFRLWTKDAVARTRHHHSITPSLRHSITPSLHHSITPSPLHQWRGIAPGPRRNVSITCGGGDENNAGDSPDVPGVDASGTADTEVFTDSPDTAGVPVAGQGGTPADSAPMGGSGAATGQPATTTP